MTCRINLPHGGLGDEKVWKYTFIFSLTWHRIAKGHVLADDNPEPVDAFGETEENMKYVRFSTIEGGPAEVPIEKHAYKYDMYTACNGREYKVYANNEEKATHTSEAVGILDGEGEQVRHFLPPSHFSVRSSYWSRTLLFRLLSPPSPALHSP